jgi:hypothetical protein
MYFKNNLTKFGILTCAALSVSTAYAVPPLSKGTAIDASKTGLPVGGVEESTKPYDLPPGYKQKKITDRDTLTSMGLPASFGNWDMVAFGAPEGAMPGVYPNASNSVFIPAEVGSGAGVFRYDIAEGTFTTLMLGDGSGVRVADPNAWDAITNGGDYARFDPATYTPWNTLLLGEETTGGRLFEVQNPYASDIADADVRWLDKVPSMNHEGVRFDAAGNLYTIDENNTGSIYKFVPTVPGDLSAGQAFVLVVDAYAGVPSENWNSAANAASIRTGAATWVALTDADGVPLTVADPFAYVNVNGGRMAADEVNGTPYGRPEDMIIANLGNKEVMILTTTSEDAAYAIILNGDTAEVKIFADRSTMDIATGEPVGSVFNNPDNMAIDADGNIYIIEDQSPDNSDIWQAIDTDGDAVADQIGRWLTQGVTGSEPSGLIFDPNVPKRAILTVQHPSSGNDALWQVTLGNRKGQLK